MQQVGTMAVNAGSRATPLRSQKRRLPQVMSMLCEDDCWGGPGRAGSSTRMVSCGSKAIQLYLRRALLEVWLRASWQGVSGHIRWPLRASFHHCEADLSTWGPQLFVRSRVETRLTLLLQWSLQPWTGCGVALLSMNNQGGPRYCKSSVLPSWNSQLPRISPTLGSS